MERDHHKRNGLLSDAAAKGAASAKKRREADKKIKIVRSVDGPYTVIAAPFWSEASAVKCAEIIGSTTVIYEPETRLTKECWYVVRPYGHNI